MDWQNLLGKHLDAIPPGLAHGGVEALFPPDEVDGEENPSIVVATDGTWEARLGKDDSIETLFVYPARGAALPLALQGAQSRRDVKAALGEPSRSGEAANIPVLGPLGAWDRYDLAQASVHIEYLDDGSIAMVTLMSPGAAP